MAEVDLDKGSIMAKNAVKKIDGKKDLSILDNIENLLTDPDKLGGGVKLSIAEVYSKGMYADRKSFGGKSLVENAKLCDEAVQIATNLNEIWNHAHTQYAWKHINFSNFDPILNMRQISAEIQNKADIVDQSKWNVLETQIKIQEVEHKLGQLDESIPQQRFKKMRLMLALGSMRSSEERDLLMLEGAMKDLIAIKGNYEELNKTVSGITEYEIEEDQAYAHMSRSIQQCIRDVRQSGSITKGEQEYLEQIGINPSKLLNAIKNYLIREENSDNWDTRELFEFVNSLANDLARNLKVSETRLSITGLNPKPDAGAASIIPVALHVEDASEEKPLLNKD